MGWFRDEAHADLTCGVHCSVVSDVVGRGTEEIDLQDSLTPEWTCAADTLLFDLVFSSFIHKLRANDAAWMGQAHQADSDSSWRSALTRMTTSLESGRAGAAGAFCVPYGWRLQSRQVDQIAGSEPKAQFIINCVCVCLRAQAGINVSILTGKKAFTLVTNRHVRDHADALHRERMSRES